MPTDLQITVPEDASSPIVAWVQSLDPPGGDATWKPTAAGEEATTLEPGDAFATKIGVFPGGGRRRIAAEGAGSITLHLNAGSMQIVAAFVQSGGVPADPPAPDAIDLWSNDKFTATLAAGQRLIAMEIRDPKPPVFAKTPGSTASPPELPAIVPNVEAIGEAALSRFVQKHGFDAVPEDLNDFTTTEEPKP